MQAHDENMEFLNFNPRSYKRSDFAISINFHYVHRFQSTLLQEERRKLQVFGIPSYYFNPRSYKRSDVSGCDRTPEARDFNPRSYKRSDFTESSHQCAPLNFNPRSYKRSDHWNRWRHLRQFDFNPRSYKRSDLAELRERQVNMISIHAPTRGATMKI